MASSPVLTSNSVVSSSYPATSSNGILIGPSSARALLTVYNGSSQTFYIKFGSVPGNSNDYTVTLAAGLYYETPLPVYTGQIWGKFFTTGSGQINVYDFATDTDLGTATASFVLNTSAPLTGGGPLSGGQLTIGVAPTGTAGTYFQVQVNQFGQVISGSTSGGGGLSGNYVSASFTINTTAPLQGGGPLTGSQLTVNLPQTGTAGSYSRVTTDAWGRVTSGSNTSDVSASFVITTTGSLQGGGPLTGSLMVLSLAPTGVQPGTYNTLIVNQFGQVTSGSNASGSVGVQTSFNLNTTAPLQGGGPLTGSSLTVSLANTGSAGSYSRVTVNQFGQVTSGSNTSDVSASFVINTSGPLTGGGPLTGSQLTVNLPTTGTAGTYFQVAVDQWGRVTSGSTSGGGGLSGNYVSASFTVNTTFPLLGGGPLTGSQITISRQTTGSVGTYDTVTVDQWGQVGSGSVTRLDRRGGIMSGTLDMGNNDLNNIANAGFGTSLFNAGAKSGSVTLADWTQADKQVIALTSNVNSSSFVAPAQVGGGLALKINTNGFSISAWDARIIWDLNSTPSQSPTGSDVAYFMWDGSNFRGSYHHQASVINVSSSFVINTTSPLQGGGPLTGSQITLSLASNVVAPGTYSSVTVDTFGRVTAGSTTSVSGNLIRVIALSGSTTFLTASAGCSKATVECWGAGGGGGAPGAGSAGQNSVASGGNSGAYLFWLTRNIPAVWTFTIGSGGLGGTSPTAGGDTKFSDALTTVVASGGLAGLSSTTSAIAKVALPPSSTAAIGGTINISGSKGGPGFAMASGASPVIGGQGGESVFWACPGTAGAAVSGQGDGGSAKGYGSGGGGGAGPASGTAPNAGAGCDGIIILREYS